MWELDQKENWALKNWCFWIWCWKRLKSPLDSKEIKPVHPKGGQSWILIGRTDDEAEVPILWSPDMKNWLLGKDTDAGKDWRQEEKGMTEDKIVGWHHRLNGHEFEQAPGVGDGQGGLGCCDSWGHKESDTTERLNWTDGFSSSHVWMWELDCKKTECWRIDPFKLWCWRRLLRVFWMARRSNQSILKESTPNIYGKDWCWNCNSSTLTTWCESPIHWKRPWCWERLKAKGEGVIED